MIGNAEPARVRQHQRRDLGHTNRRLLKLDAALRMCVTCYLKVLSIYPCAVVDTGCSRSDIGNDRDPWLRRGVAAPPTCTMNPPAGKFVVSNMPSFTAFHIDRCNARAVRSGMPASSLLCAASSSGRRRESSACSSLATLRATGNPFSTTPPFRFAAASLSSSSASTVSLQLTPQC